MLSVLNQPVAWWEVRTSFNQTASAGGVGTEKLVVGTAPEANANGPMAKRILSPCSQTRATDTSMLFALVQESNLLTSSAGIGLPARTPAASPSAAGTKSVFATIALEWSASF